MKNKLLVVITIMSVILWTIAPGISADSIDLKDTYAENIDDDSEDIEDNCLYGDEDENEDLDLDQDEDEDQDQDDDEDQINPWEEAKNKFELEKEKTEVQKEIIEEQKDILEEQKDILEKQYKIAQKSENIELAKELLGQIDLVNQDIELMKLLIKQKKDEMKAIIKNLYTVEELEKLEELSKKLKEANKDIIVMPIDSIIMEGKIIKFDIPPIIKNKTIFVPIKMLSDCLGAKVNWNPEEQTVTIINETTQVILQLNKSIAYVNGVEVTIGAAPEIINSTTVIPFRFIAETLGLEVKWDSEIGTVEVYDGQAKVGTKIIQ